VVHAIAVSLARMDIYDLTVPQLIRTLRNLDRWMEKAATHSDPETLLTARLAPDQYNFTRQVQVIADNAKMMPGRLAGREWPSHPDTESTFEQLRARVLSVVSYLETFQRADFADSATRDIRLPWMKEGQYMKAYDYLVEFGLPNFYFHVVTAYAILRHRGLPLGKYDFLGQITIQA
jgi:uncharacterized protein